LQSPKIFLPTISTTFPQAVSAPRSLTKSF
jgi:hypothetical protein